MRYLQTFLWQHLHKSCISFYNVFIFLDPESLLTKRWSSLCALLMSLILSMFYDDSKTVFRINFQYICTFYLVFVCAFLYHLFAGSLSNFNKSIPSLCPSFFGAPVLWLSTMPCSTGNSGDKCWDDQDGEEIGCLS